MIISLVVLNCFQNPGVAAFDAISRNTKQRIGKWLSIIILILAFNINCFAGDSISVLVHFAFDKYSLTNDAQMQLDQLIKAAPETLANIKVYGFTDQVGSNSYNKKLSLKRATEVSNYLIKTGVLPNTITTVQGKGETEPISVQMDKVSMQQNRRVLVMIEYRAKADNQVVSNDGNKKNVGIEPSEKETPTPALIDQVKDNKTKVGDQIILRHINFEGGRHVFLPQSYSALTELLNTLKEIPTLKIEIQGHICCVDGTMDGEDNDLGTLDLSVQRAKAVYNYLIANGINAARMSYEGMGHKYPITQERSEEDKTINRRVEIKIISK
jgi:outer membrane protein OmpA-like peptidoglycan-associated protein